VLVNLLREFDDEFGKFFGIVLFMGEVLVGVLKATVTRP